jgi:hypothetical protein
VFSTGPARGKAYARTLTGVESRVAALGAPGLDIVQHGVVMLLDKLDGVGADRQVKWRFSLRCDFNKQAAESVRIALLGMVGGLRGGAKRSI